MIFSAAILTGGQSRRMGRDKAWLSVRGRPLIERSVALVREAGAGEVLISGRAGQDFSALDVPVLLDAKPGWGPLGGIDRALGVAAHPWILVLAVDLPHMTLECLRWMCGIISAGVTCASPGASSSGEIGVCGGATGVVPLLHGRPEPLAAIYPRQARRIASRLLSQKRLAAREFAEVCVGDGLTSVAPVPPEYETCFTNWNAPEDVA